MNRQGDERSGANMAAFMRRRLSSGLLALAVVAASLTTAALPAQADAPGTYSRPVTGAKIVIDAETGLVPGEPNRCLISVYLTVPGQINAISYEFGFTDTVKFYDDPIILTPAGFDPTATNWRQDDFFDLGILGHNLAGMSAGQGCADGIAHYEERFTITSARVPVAIAAPLIDIESPSYYEDPVHWAYDQGVTTGTSASTFSPVVDVPRWQMALFLRRLADLLGLDITTAPSGFLDISTQSQDTQDAIGWLKRTEITTGTSTTTYSPTAAVSRWQMALFLSRFAAWFGLDITHAPDTFQDTGSLSDEAREAIGWLQDTEITTGTSPTTFSPYEFVTRAQMVTFLKRLWELLYLS